MQQKANGITSLCIRYTTKCRKKIEKNSTPIGMFVCVCVAYVTLPRGSDFWSTSIEMYAGNISEGNVYVK